MIAESRRHLKKSYDHWKFLKIIFQYLDIYFREVCGVINKMCIKIYYIRIIFYGGMKLK